MAVFRFSRERWMKVRQRRKTVILGAAGRDFHNFNTRFRDNEDYEVLAFTATQIPNVSGRIYPAELAGSLYPNGVPIVPEDEIESLIRDRGADMVVFSYSDVSHEYVMHLASRVIALGAEFSLLGARQTMLGSKKPVVAVCAVRTGSGKSQTTRAVSSVLVGKGRKVTVVRHPMPYGDLGRQALQRFARYEDLDLHDCTIEEREEYEQHIAMGVVVYAGVDYRAILSEAEKESDVIIWDGGNNDTPFFAPDLHITVTDPHRAGHELLYHPGETNLRMADVVVINKVDTASLADIEKVRDNTMAVNPGAVILEAASPLYADKPELVRGKRVLVIEDGPTLTHGGMRYGAGTVAARKWGAREIVDPRPYAVGSIEDVYRKYEAIGPLLPAMGYGPQQIEELEETIRKVPCETIVVGTPIDLTRIISTEKPCVRVRYELQVIGKPDLRDVLERF
jgi:predicted GTPase